MCDTSDDTAHPFSPAVSAASATPPFDPAYYTWSLLFRAQLGQASPSDVRKYVHSKSIANEAADCKKCESWRDWLLEYSPTVTFLRDNIRKLGGDVGKANIVCRRCETLHPRGMIRGAFSGQAGILLCANHINSWKSMEDVLAHELVHAYDSMRFQFDKHDLRHSACTEIRANMLSGECRWAREFFTNKQYKFTMHFQDCVRRRAVLALRMHPSCKDDVQAVRTVNEVWLPCFSDTRPFDEVYR